MSMSITPCLEFRRLRPCLRSKVCLILLYISAAVAQILLPKLAMEGTLKIMFLTATYRKLALKYHPDVNKAEGAKVRRKHFLLMAGRDMSPLPHDRAAFCPPGPGMLLLWKLIRCQPPFSPVLLCLGEDAF